MNEDTQVEREKVLRQLEQQREQIGALLDKPRKMSSAMAGVRGDFPKSQTMRLFISEPMLTAGLSALTARLLGLRALQLLRALSSAFRAMRNISQQDSTAPT